MIDRPPPELFAERPVRSDYGQDKNVMLKRLATVTVVLFLIIGGVWSVIAHFMQSESQPQEIPTIKAEAGVKEKPEEPGGIDIPHQNVMVFQQLDNTQDGKPPVEHLLPQPETPQPVPTTIPTTSEETASTPPQQATASASVPETPAASAIDTPIQSATIPTTVTTSVPATVTPAPVAEVKPQTVVTEEPKKEEPKKEVVATIVKPVEPPAPARLPESLFTGDMPKVPKATTATSATGPMIQLASVQDQKAGQALIKSLEAKYATELRGVSLRLVRADLGSKGVYYRIQSEAMSDDKARSLCGVLKSRNAACMLVHP